MKIKIIKPVIAGRKVLAKDTTPDVDDKVAAKLIKDGFAVEFIERQQQQQQQQQPPVPTAEELEAQFGSLTKPQLGKALASAKQVGANDPDYPAAQVVVGFIQEKLKA